MQQTRVQQGLPYYEKFAGNYPDVQSLAAADDESVMKLWQGLGYYNRARNMLRTARIISHEYKGKFPRSYDELIRLKGIGPYTAAAVSSFAFNEPRAVVDGNVYRVLARVFNLDLPINTTHGKRAFAGAADEYLNRAKPGMHNQAMMELGATVCTPRSPKCGECPLRISCIAHRENAVAKLPVKIAARPPKERFLAYFLAEEDGFTYITQRPRGGLWGDLYELPSVEFASAVRENVIRDSPHFRELFPNPGACETELVYSTRHQLTHQSIHAEFYRLRSARSLKPLKGNWRKVELAELSRFPVARLFEKFLDYYTLQQ
jgi:A/G-specific adenine glycosylase